MTQAQHLIRLVHDDPGHISVEFTCTGDRSSPCHVFPDNAETWSGEEAQQHGVPHETCWIQDWMDAGCAKYCGPADGEVHSGPITIDFDGICVSWSYAS